MKKTKIIAVISVTAVTLLCGSVVMPALATTSTNNNQEYNYKLNNISAFDDFATNSDEMKSKQEFAAKNNNSIELKKSNSSVAYASNDSASNNLNVKDACDEAFEKEEEESNKNDLKAYEILSKYKGFKYARTEFITDYELDLTYMREMVKLMESGKLPKYEEYVLHKYVSRRAYWITDESISAEFEKWMLG